MVPCFRLQISGAQRSSPPVSNGLLPPQVKSGRGTTAGMVLNMIKDDEIAISSPKGRLGTAAGDVAFSKGKENLTVSSLLGDSSNQGLGQAAMKKVLEKKVDGLEKKGAMLKELVVIPVSILDQAFASIANDATTKAYVLVLCDDNKIISKTITLMVDGESFLIKVLEEEWPMDPDWWLAGEWRSSDTSLEVSDTDFNNSNGRYSVGDDAVVMAADYAETEVESKLCLNRILFQFLN
ncbi:hypothetical protein SLEP1_g27016 [Rubroshorea leprosula]|uniref:Uncharacterized protein n=1 Tax=Rubroshorea leprosula TaxID=152421 RepID=A0AAV5JYD6_9ROSI|nr:hypothetical protein SLEP1_g27016 [Rubroshorea leprosula]